MAVATTQPLLTGLRYLFSHEGEMAVAHCLELDLVSNGQDIAEAEESLNALVLAQIASCFVSGNWSQLQTKAPEAYWKALEKAKLLGHASLQVEVPPILLAVEKRVASLPVARFEMSNELVAA